MHKFSANLDCLVEHFLDAASYFGGVGVRELNENLEELKRVPCMTLNIGCKRLDGRTGNRNVIHSHNPLAGKLDKVEGIRGERQKRVKKAKLVECVFPRLPESSDCVLIFVTLFLVLVC